MAVDCGLLTDLDQIQRLFAKLAEIPDGFGLDIETGYHGPPQEKYGLHPETAFVAGVSVSGDPAWARYIPLQHTHSFRNVDDIEFARVLAPLLGSGKLMAHNAKFELTHLAKFCRDRLTADELERAGLDPDGYFPIFSDSMIEAYMLGKFEYHGLKYLTKKVFDYDQVEITDLFTFKSEKQKKSMRFSDLELTPAVISYACDDAAWCLALSRLHKPQVDTKMLYRVEMALIPVLGRMEDYGVAFDWAAMAKEQHRTQRFLDLLRVEIMRDLSTLLDRPVDINLGSSAQVADVLYSDTSQGGLGLTTTRVSEKTGKMSTDADALTGLAQKHSVVQKIVNWRELRKLIGSYLEKYPREFNYASDGRTHPSHSQTSVVSGRFAVTEPPYQQLPKKYEYSLYGGEEYHLNFRNFVTSGPDYYLLGFDYSQVELRVLTGLSGEPALIKAYNEGRDVHALTASMLFEIPVSEITKDQRAVGKAQPVDSPILTPDGWSPMGELEVGDYVIGSDGRPVRVTGVFPQGEKDIYRVTATDGSSAEMCDEHLLTVKSRNTKGAKWKTVPLQTLRCASSGLTTTLSNGYEKAKWRLPSRPVIDYLNSAQLPIDPYVLGLLLGDGGFRHPWGPYFGCGDPELVAAVVSECERLGGRPHWVSRSETRGDDWQECYLVSGEKNGSNYLTRALRDIGLWNKIDSEKFIPDIYMRASSEDRLALIQGLMDTDGNVLASGAALKVTARALVEGVCELSRSLGGSGTLGGCSEAAVAEPWVDHDGIERVIQSKKPVWRTQVRLPNEMRAFRLPRKLVSQTKTVKNTHDVSIAGAEWSRRAESICVSVDADDGLYVTDGMLLVHNTTNFAIVYGQGAKGMSERMGMSKERAQTFIDKYFSMYSSVRSWYNQQMKEGVSAKYTTSKFGRIHPIWYLDSDKPSVRATGERLTVNAPVQGCLPSDTRVLTRQGGWVPIGEFVDGSEVWTGAEWASAVRLPKGIAPRVRLRLSDGRTFDCDDRHRLLVSEGAWPEWCSVTEIKGKRLVRDMEQDWGLADDHSVEDWYWAGRMVGDGHVSYRKDPDTGWHRTSWSCAFSAKRESGVADQFCRWLSVAPDGVFPRFAGRTSSRTGFVVERSKKSNTIKVSGGTRVGAEFWLSMGLDPNLKAREKRVPDVVFTLDRARRQAFFDGVYGADGSSREPRLISASHRLLADLLRLAQTLGFEGWISKEYTHKVTGTSWREVYFKEPRTNDLVVEDVQYLDTEEMFTLSVDHEHRAFSSEGLISKNSAADLAKVGMVRADRALRGAGLTDQVHLIMNIHDALVYEVHRSVHPQRIIDLVHPEVCLPVPGWPRIEADWEIGVRWGSMRKLKLDADNQIIMPDREPAAAAG